VPGVFPRTARKARIRVTVVLDSVMVTPGSVMVTPESVMVAPDKVIVEGAGQLDTLTWEAD